MSPSPYRKIVTELPVRESLPLLDAMMRCEPRSMLGQPPIVWDRAEGFQVFDPYGNMWLDWSSGVLVANVGHAPESVRREISELTKKGQLFSYCFPAENRTKLAQKLVDLTPPNLNKAFLLSTGSETTECAIKLSRAHGIANHGRSKVGVISFSSAFHGRTMGAQQAGGTPSAKDWIGNLDPGFHQVPYPDGYLCEDTSFDVFLKSVENCGLSPAEIAGVLMEPYQGGIVSLAPRQYMQQLRAWCSEHDIILTIDEVQSGFGRTGKLFAFEHFDIDPDLLCLGKAISGSLPLAAVVGRSDLLDQFPPGSMTSTWGGHSLACGAALKNLEILLDENLAERSLALGELCRENFNTLKERFPEYIGAVFGTGLVWGIHMIDSKSRRPCGITAQKVVDRCFKKGLLLFAPVGPGGATVKICPPLVITEDALIDGFRTLEECFVEMFALSGQEA